MSNNLATSLATAIVSRETFDAEASRRSLATPPTSWRQVDSAIGMAASAGHVD